MSTTIQVTYYEEKMMRHADAMEMYTSRTATAAWCSFALGVLAFLVSSYFSLCEHLRKQKAHEQQHQNTPPNLPDNINLNVSIGRSLYRKFARFLWDMGGPPEEDPPRVMTPLPAPIAGTPSGIRGGEDDTGRNKSANDASPSVDSPRPTRLRQRPIRYVSEDN